MTKLDSVEQYKECEHCQLPIKGSEFVSATDRTDNNYRIRYYHKDCFNEYCKDESDGV